MTSASTESSRIAGAVRNATFTVRRRGFDEHEVHAYLTEIADTIQRQENEIAALRAERNSGGDSTAEISDQAVLMFSEAQKVADSLIDEAVMHARDLMTSARTQQRDIVKEAQQAAESAVRQAETADRSGHVGGYDRPVPEIEYVRTFAKVAQVQLRSVLDALNEQVETLGEVPRLDGPENPSGHGPAV